MVASKKDRRHSGWITPVLTADPEVLKEESLDLNLDYYSDWDNYRDGQRNGTDQTLMGSRTANAGKLKRQERIRAARRRDE